MPRALLCGRRESGGGGAVPFEGGAVPRTDAPLALVLWGVGAEGGAGTTRDPGGSALTALSMNFGISVTFSFLSTAKTWQYIMPARDTVVYTN